MMILSSWAETGAAPTPAATISVTAAALHALPHGPYAKLSLSRRAADRSHPMTETPEPILALDDVRLTLASRAGPVEILRGVSLGVAKGEAVGIIGPSGSGKSSLLMIMGGLEQASGGKVAALGRDMTTLDEDALARFRLAHMGVVFQSFHLLPTMTALENVAAPLELAGDKAAFEKAAEELTSVGLGDRLGHYPAQLSGGEQQRVALARAAAPQPDILLADEPTGNLDQNTGSTIIDLLFRFREERGATLVLVTHEAGLAARCDRVIRMRDGQIEAEDSGHREAAE
jgi:putative ABC transport system ATP-binding protein